MSGPELTLCPNAFRAQNPNNDSGYSELHAETLNRTVLDVDVPFAAFMRTGTYDSRYMMARTARALTKAYDKTDGRATNLVAHTAPAWRCLLARRHRVSHVAG